MLLISPCFAPKNHGYPTHESDQRFLCLVINIEGNNSSDF